MTYGSSSGKRRGFAAPRLLAAAMLLAGSATPAGAREGQQLTAERLFDPAQVVDIRIEIAEADWKALCSQSRSFTDALGKTPAKSPFKYYKGVVTIDGVRIEEVGVRKKGFLGSLDSVRPSLKIKFSEYKEQSPVAGLDRLTLNNNKQDRSQASQFLIYKLFNASGTAAPRCNFAKVTVNGKSLGAYSHVESVKAPFLKNRFGDSGGDLHEGTVADLFVDTISKLESKTKASKTDHLQAIAEVAAETELNHEQLERLLDVEAFLKFWATESLVGFSDGYTNNQNNYFVYRKPSNGKLYFIPWGADSAFNNTKSVHSQSVLAHRLYSDPKTRNRYHATLKDLLANHWDETKLLAELDRIEALLKDHLHSSQQDFPHALKYMRGFIRSRRKVLQREIDKWPANLASGPRRPTYFKVIGEGKAKFATEWRSKSPEQPLTTGKVEIELTLNGKPVKFLQVGASAEPSKWPARGDGRPPAIILSGERESDGEPLMLMMSLSDGSLRPTKKPAVVRGMLIEGAQGALLDPKRIKFVTGSMKLDEAEMKDGAAVSGKVDLKIMRIAGGKPKP